MEITVKVRSHNIVLSCTASFAAYLVLEGWDVWAKDAQWRRINKSAHKANFSTAGVYPVELEMTALEELLFNTEFIGLCEIVELEDQFMAQEDVFVFLEELNIMGMIDAQPEMTAAPMWGNVCLN